MITITEREIYEITKDIYMDYGDEIIGKHNPLEGEKSFALCIIEQILGLLSRDNKNDERIIIYTQSMIRISAEELSEYRVFLKAMYNDKTVEDRALSGKRLTFYERLIIDEMMKSNLGEYLFKSDYQLCCYSAMEAFLIGLYCILYKGIDMSVGHIDLISDLDDRLQTINVFEDEKDNNSIYIQWHCANKINNMYTLYKTQYVGLEAESILDLVSADVIEEDYYLKDDRFTIAPSILMKQYLSIIEREVNILITLSGVGDADGKHLSWYDMKNRVKKRGVNIDYLPFKLYEALEDLYRFRNGTMHGETNISNGDYEIMRQYKAQGLFEGISRKKLELKGIALHPTVDEIENMFKTE